MIDKIQLSQGVNSSKTHMTKMKNKWADCSTVVSAQPTLKKVRLGWLVKRGDRYEQMKKPIEEFSCNSEVSFQNSDVRLGLFDRIILTSFRDSKGISCDLWTFLKEQKLRLFTLYIITSPKGCAETCEQLKTIQSSHHENANPQLSRPNKDLKGSTAVSHKNSAPLKNTIFMNYEVIHQSEYTSDYCICYLHKNDLYNHKLDEYGCMPIAEFNPIDSGHKIAEIQVDDKVLLLIYISNDDLSRDFNFPAVDILDDDNHYILYDVNEFHGRCEDKNGVGVITNCTDSCKPIFSWYKDDKIVSQGLLKYWISDIDQDSVYKCIVRCKSQNLELISSNFKWSENNKFRESTLQTNTLQILPNAMNGSIKPIKRELFKIFQDILGAGAQGKVKKGKWCNFNVAVRSINLSGANLKLACREIKVLEDIRHPNIVQLMAYCIDKNSVHLLMELFHSYSLSDQFCQAINYLHLKENSIIHGDIKPANILLHTNGTVKVCDLGLSKFKKMSSSLRTTVGGTGFVKGTPLYMAPELILENKEATVHSDVWSLTCTLIELYTEKSIWDNVEDQGQLKAM
ncbi:hypothetical protein KQX54_003248 [Cotesia glomerata]|uniref:Protein kinase domain-containing protein n=1 Tax=Cotesia glomerata TaxID=32391 RepID=A0AAV7J137_COTGL|nr:hypothetical protein KQX54_003248 [Cotesia glomerata]